MHRARPPWPTKQPTSSSVTREPRSAYPRTTVNSLATDTAPRDPNPPLGRPPSRRRSPVRTGLVIVVAVVAGLVAARLMIDRFTPHLYAGTVLQQSETAPPLDGLRYASGDPVDLAVFDGQVTLVFFGYTNCPDVCPMTLSTVDRALDELDTDRRDRVTMMMISVDPERDELSSLQEYVGFFDPEFLGVGGPSESIDRAASLYGVYYEIRRSEGQGQSAVEGESRPEDEPYLVDHTASLMGIGPDGALRVVWASDVTSTALAADLEELLS